MEASDFGLGPSSSSTDTKGQNERPNTQPPCFLCEGVAQKSKIPQTAVWGLFEVLSKRPDRDSNFSNPPNGSLGIVQVRPIYLLATLSCKLVASDK